MLININDIMISEVISVDTKTLLIRMTPKMHKKIKMYCVEHDLSMQEFILSTIMESVGMQPEKPERLEEAV